MLRRCVIATLCTMLSAVALASPPVSAEQDPPDSGERVLSGATPPHVDPEALVYQRLLAERGAYPERQPVLVVNMGVLPDGDRSEDVRVSLGRAEVLASLDVFDETERSAQRQLQAMSGGRSRLVPAADGGRGDVFAGNGVTTHPDYVTLDEAQLERWQQEPNRVRSACSEYARSLVGNGAVNGDIRVICNWVDHIGECGESCAALQRAGVTVALSERGYGSDPRVVSELLSRKEYRHDRDWCHWVQCRQELFSLSPVRGDLWLDAAHRIGSGWVLPRVVYDDGWYPVGTPGVAGAPSVYVLPVPSASPLRTFVTVENRGGGQLDEGADRGLAIALHRQLDRSWRLGSPRELGSYVATPCRPGPDRGSCPPLDLSGYTSYGIGDFSPAGPWFITPQNRRPSLGSDEVDPLGPLREQSAWNPGDPRTPARSWVNPGRLTLPGWERTAHYANRSEAEADVARHTELLAQQTAGFEGPAGTVSVRGIGVAGEVQWAYFDVPGPGVMVDCQVAAERGRSAFAVSRQAVNELAVPVRNTDEAWARTFRIEGRVLQGWSVEPVEIRLGPGEERPVRLVLRGPDNWWLEQFPPPVEVVATEVPSDPGAKGDSTDHDTGAQSPKAGPFADAPKEGSDPFDPWAPIGVTSNEEQYQLVSSSCHLALS